MKVLLLASLAIALAVPAQAAPKHKRHYQPRQTQTYQPQIACTDVGCLPVPRGCYPTGGRTLDGTPSGFDVMVCPNGVRYGNL